MSELWPETTVEKSRLTIQESRYLRRNGKVMFKNMAGTVHFIYESEMDNSLYRLRCVKNSGPYTAFETAEDLLEAGWILSS